MDVGEGNDTVKNDGNYSTITGGLGDDSITNSGNYVIYRYADGDGNDIISGFNTNDRLYITEGNISDAVVDDEGNDVIIYVGEGSITLKDAVEKNLQLRIGDTTLTTVFHSLVVNGTSGGADNLNNTLDGAIVNVFEGNDTVTNSGNEVLIKGGAGKDKINLEGDAQNVTIDSGAGNDTITTNGKGNVIKFKEGDGKDVLVGYDTSDTILADVDYSLIKGSDVIFYSGKETLTIKNGRGKNITVLNSAGNLVSREYKDKWVAGTDGADELSNQNASYLINGFGGKDTINNTGKKVTITGDAGNDTINNTGNEVSIDGGKGNDFIFSAGNNVTINGDAGNEKITVGSGAQEVSVIGGKGNDTVINYGGGVNIDGGDGNDKVTLKGGSSEIQVYGGKGNDTVTASGENITIDGGVGNDKIIVNNDAQFIEVHGGAGNVIEYSAGNGKDIITGYGTADTLKIVSGSVSKATLKSSDIILTIGSGNVTFKGAKSKAITVQNSDGSIAIYKVNGKDVESETVTTSSYVSTPKLWGNISNYDLFDGGAQIYSGDENLSDIVETSGSVTIEITFGTGGDTLDTTLAVNGNLKEENEY